MTQPLKGQLDFRTKTYKRNELNGANLDFKKWLWRLGGRELKFRVLGWQSVMEDLGVGWMWCQQEENTRKTKAENDRVSN